MSRQRLGFRWAGEGLLSAYCFCLTLQVGYNALMPHVPIRQTSLEKNVKAEAQVGSLSRQSLMLWLDRVLGTSVHAHCQSSREQMWRWSKQRPPAVMKPPSLAQRLAAKFAAATDCEATPEIPCPVAWLSEVKVFKEPRNWTDQSRRAPQPKPRGFLGCSSWVVPQPGVRGHGKNGWYVSGVSPNGYVGGGLQG